MHPIVARLVSRPEGGVDPQMYLALHTTLPLDGALDLIEIDDVARSWRAAAMRDSKRLADLIAEANARGG